MLYYNKFLKNRPLHVSHDALLQGGRGNIQNFQLSCAVKLFLHHACVCVTHFVPSKVLSLSKFCKISPNWGGGGGGGILAPI